MTERNGFDALFKTINDVADKLNAYFGDSADICLSLLAALTHEFY